MKDNSRMLIDREAALVIKTITNTAIEISEKEEKQALLFQNMALKLNFNFAKEKYLMLRNFFIINECHVYRRHLLWIFNIKE